MKYLVAYRGVNDPGCGSSSPLLSVAAAGPYRSWKDETRQQRESDRSRELTWVWAGRGMGVGRAKPRRNPDKNN